MKNIYTKIREGLYLKSFIAVIFSVLIYAGCKKPTEGIVVAISTASLFESPVLVQFENANASSTAQLGDFAVTISGKDAGLVQMGSGGSNFKASGGFLPMALKPGVKASAANPIVFNVYAEIPGYAPVTRTITIISDSLSVYKVKALEYAKPAEGTAVVQTQTALNAGVSNLVTIATVPSPTVTEVANIVIPASTQMLDANNNVINGATLKSNIVNVGTGSLSAATLFPGGLSAANVLDANGAAIPGGVNFVPAGSLSIDMSVGGAPVKKFSKPLTIEQGIAPGLTNFETGKPVKAGETIPLWSLDEQTGQWKAEGNAVVAEVGGKLVAKYTINHLSFWSVSWTWTYFDATNKNTVNKSLVINLLPANTPWISVSWYDVFLAEPGTNGYPIGFAFAYWSTYKPQIDFFEEGRTVGRSYEITTIPGKYGFSIPRIPLANAVKVLVCDNRGKIVGESAVFDPTIIRTIDVNVNAPKIDFVNVKVDVQVKCGNKNMVSPATGSFVIENKTEGGYDPVYLKNGAISSAVKLVVGHQYQVIGVFNGVIYRTGTFTMGKTNVDIPTGSGGFVAATSYDQGSNTITIKGSFSMDCK